LAVPRQNGKNAVLEIRELYGMIALGERFLHTAHEVKTARKAFGRLASFFENPAAYPELAALVKEIRRTNGQEAIVLTNGGSVEFVARSKGSGRGFSVDVLVMDEAQELSDDAYEALLPTISASPNPQQIMTGTPPGPAANGEVFTRLRESGLAGKDKRMSWLEWGCLGEGVDLDDRTNWARANPALGIRLTVGFTQGERDSFSDEGFARERLGMWDGAVSQRVIDARTWLTLADPLSRLVSDVAFALDMNPTRSTTSIAASGLRADGLPHVEVVDNRNGAPDWVVSRVVELVNRWQPRAVVVDEFSPAAALVDDLRRAGVTVTVTRSRDMTAACGRFYDSAMTGQLRHIDQPTLNLALAAARRRAVGTGGAWAWHRLNTESDITPLVAASLALWGVSAAGITTKKRRGSGRVVVL
jgi:phage terminase large subunit-like protein